MLPSAIISVKEVILWEYAKLMSEEILGDRHNWLFNLHNFEILNSDKYAWTSILKKENKLDLNKCAFCDSGEDLEVNRIVPKKLCKAAEMHNIIRACKKCNLSKGHKDLLDWWAPNVRDKIPRNLMARYLKMLYMCHECNGTVESCAFDKNGNRDLSNIRYPLKKHCILSKARL